MYCKYYQAKVNVTTTWFVMGIFRAEDGVAFERTLEHAHEQLEFFVPHEYEERFIEIMNALQQQGHIITFSELANRYLPS